MPNQSLDSLFKLVHSLKRNIQLQIETLEFDISLMHVHVLKIIANTLNCTAIDIANGLDRDKAQVTRLLNALIKQKLIIKVPNTEDKRSQCLHITEQGQAIMIKIKDVDNVILGKMTQGISNDEMKTFQCVADQLINNLMRE